MLFLSAIKLKKIFELENSNIILWLYQICFKLLMQNLIVPRNININLRNNYLYEDIVYKNFIDEFKYLILFMDSIIVEKFITP